MDEQSRSDLDYDERTVVAMLAALWSCPESKRLDSAATLVKVFVEHGPCVPPMAEDLPFLGCPWCNLRVQGLPLRGTVWGTAL